MWNMISLPSETRDPRHIDYTLYFLVLDEGCGLIPGCEKCTDGLICEKCRSSFIPVEYERNKKKIVRCTRSCPMGFNMTSRTPHSTLCVRTHFRKSVVLFSFIHESLCKTYNSLIFLSFDLGEREERASNLYLPLWLYFIYASARSNISARMLSCWKRGSPLELWSATV